MFSKASELGGLTLVAVGLGQLLGTSAALIFAGCALVLIGITTNDKEVKGFFAYRFHMLRFHWHRQLAKENDEPSNPHPPLVIDPMADERARHMAKQRIARAKLHDRIPVDELEDLEY